MSIIGGEIKSQITQRTEFLENKIVTIAMLKLVFFRPIETEGHDTSTNSTVESGRVGTSWYMCHRITTRIFPYSSLIPDCLVGSRPPYDSTVELGWLMWHGL